MRISGENFSKLKPLLSRALQDDAKLSFTYHEKPRVGTIVDFGFGQQGAFVTVKSEDVVKSFSLSKISDLKVLEVIK
tara:strand:- start:1159 stop:1389 length:231 start_codon:yes stop_codon:yes gene_type:complete